MLRRSFALVFVLTGVATVFFYARLWRRSGVLTDLEFYEIRYSGNAASVVRGFRAGYLGLLFNCMIMATVNLAACKIAGILFGLERWQTLLGVGDRSRHERAARHLGGVCGRHQLDTERAHRLVQRVGRHASGQQAPERVLAGAALRRGARVALVGAAAADAVVLLGDVGEIQEVRERARHRQRFVDRHLLEDTRQRRKVRVAAAPRLLRQRTDPLRGARVRQRCADIRRRSGCRCAAGSRGGRRRACATARRHRPADRRSPRRAGASGGP